MKVIIDTNIIISALIKDSITRKIIVESGWEFYYPEVSLHELRENKTEILEKSGLEETEYLKLASKILSYMNLLSDEQIAVNLNQAKKELGKIDPDDIPFLAAALSIPDSFIWSHDSDLEKQKLVKVIKTKDILEFLFL
ncbi:MAG TPA: putative toxin-antitoxin system toxin component, PIN family [archaeon]|nr:putative toxin-antitoxin system toxin component, PIN family [archaeon]